MTDSRQAINDLKERMGRSIIGQEQVVERLLLTLLCDGNVLVGGWTESRNFPTTTGAYADSFAGGYQDAFIAKLDATGSSLLWSTYLGGGKDEPEDDSFVIAGQRFTSRLIVGTGKYKDAGGGYSTRLKLEADEFGNIVYYDELYFRFRELKLD